MDNNKAEKNKLDLIKLDLFEPFIHDNIRLSSNVIKNHDFDDVLIKVLDYVLCIKIKKARLKGSQRDQNNLFKKHILVADKLHLETLDYITNHIDKFTNDHKDVIDISKCEEEKLIFITVFKTEGRMDYDVVHDNDNIGRYNIFSEEDFRIAANYLYTPVNFLLYLNFRLYATSKFSMPYSEKIKHSAKKIIFVEGVNREFDVLNEYLKRESDTRDINDESIEWFKNQFLYQLKQSKYSPIQYYLFIKAFSTLTREKITLFKNLYHNTERTPGKVTIFKTGLNESLDYGFVFVNKSDTLITVLNDKIEKMLAKVDINRFGIITFDIEKGKKTLTITYADFGKNIIT